MSAKIAAITFDPELVAILEAEGDSLHDAAEQHIVLDLYRVGKVSDHEAARLLGMDLDQFMRWAGERGVPYMRHSAEEFRGDVAAVMDVLDRSG